MCLLLLPIPIASLGHSKGTYQSKADGENRADDIGCITAHQNKWQ